MHPPKTHSVTVGYIAWLFGIFGAHRFYYGKPVSGVLYMLTLGVFGVGWLVDSFLIPSMEEEARHRFVAGEVDYSACWLLLFFGGIFGLHRFYLGHAFWGLLYLFTGGIFFLGVIHDALMLNDLVSRQNHDSHGYSRSAGYRRRAAY